MKKRECRQSITAYSMRFRLTAGDAPGIFYRPASWHRALRKQAAPASGRARYKPDFQLVQDEVHGAAFQRITERTLHIFHWHCPALSNLLQYRTISVAPLL